MPDTKGLPLDVTVAGIPGPLPSLKVTGVGETPVDVLGPDGEVFARVGRKGTQVNVHSPVWVPTAQAANRDLLDSVVDPSAKPEFVTASRAQDLIWPDPRILPKRLAAGAAEPGDKAKWTLPIVVAGKRVTLRGTTVLAEVKPEFTPAPVESAEPVQTTPPADAAASATPKGGATAIVIGGIAAAVCVLAAGALVVRRAAALSLNPGLNEEGRHGAAPLRSPPFRPASTDDAGPAPAAPGRFGRTVRHRVRLRLLR